MFICFKLDFILFREGNRKHKTGEIPTKFLVFVFFCAGKASISWRIYSICLPFDMSKVAISPYFSFGDFRL